MFISAKYLWIWKQLILMDEKYCFSLISDCKMNFRIASRGYIHKLSHWRNIQIHNVSWYWRVSRPDGTGNINILNLCPQDKSSLTCCLLAHNCYYQMTLKMLVCQRQTLGASVIHQCNWGFWGIYKEREKELNKDWCLWRIVSDLKFNKKTKTGTMTCSRLRSVWGFVFV